MKKLILSLLTILVMSSLIGCDFKKESKEYKAENPKFEKSIKFKKISAPYDNIVALTEDGELYAFNDMCNPVKIDDDVIEFTDEYYKTKNGEVFIPNFPAYYTATSFPKNSPLKEDIDAYEYSIKLDVKNVDTVLCSHFSINSVTYTTTDGMLVRNCNGNEQKVKLRINALNDLYNFKIQDDKAYENK